MFSQTNTAYPHCLIGFLFKVIVFCQKIVAIFLKGKNSSDFFEGKK